MVFSTIEILALILIVFSIIKLVVILISPNAWFGFARKVYIKPEITSATATVLAAIVLYYLISSGVTITKVLATTLFIALLIVIGFAKYADQISDWAEKQDMQGILMKQWFYTLIWVALLLWGIQEIFFS